MIDLQRNACWTLRRIRLLAAVARLQGTALTSLRGLADDDLLGGQRWSVQPSGTTLMSAAAAGIARVRVRADDAVVSGAALAWCWQRLGGDRQLDV